MDNIDSILAADPPRSLRQILDREHYPKDWPTRKKYYPSPGDWRDEVFYFLLPDRFSDGQEQPARLLNCDLSTPQGVQRIRALRGPDWRWNRWQSSGAERFQGGTLAGIQSKLPYLKDLGVTTLWVGPVFRQRIEENTYHGYGIQDFLDVDPRFGTRRDLVNLVDATHQARMRIVLDVIFNHSGCNWLYDAAASNVFEPPYLAQSSYDPIWPRNGYGGAMTDPNQAFGRDDYLWPKDLQGKDRYLRAGTGNLGAGDIKDDYAEHKRTDFCRLRKFNLFNDETLTALALAYHYWIALADVDGFRIDTFKHVTQDQARNFCNAIKEYAEDLGKDDFFLVAEIAGGDAAQDRYLGIAGRNLNACLDIGEQREIVCNVGKGLRSPGAFFGGFNYYDDGMGSHRNWGSRHLSISNDHDHVFGPKVRLAADASNDHQGAAVAAFQLFALGIPCLYYGTEQGLASGAEHEEQKYLSWGSHDCLLREAMFGPEHPRPAGWAGTQGQVDASEVGFGPHGTAGWHVFNKKHPIYKRIAQLAKVRRRFKPLRRGRQYQRHVSYRNDPFAYPSAGQLVAWSRIFDDQEVLVVVNAHGGEPQGARVAVDGRLSAEEGLEIVANTDPTAPAGMRPGDRLNVGSDGYWRFVALDQWRLGPSEVMVLANQSAIDAANRGGPR
jgi:glycosidase